MAEGTPAGRPGWVAIVPTLGASRHLAASVDALRRQGAHVVVVAPEGHDLDHLHDGLSVAGIQRIQRVFTAGAVGFAQANLAGLDAAPPCRFVALVNDDAVVEAGWAGALLAELEAHPDAAAAQGVVLDMDSGRVDGAGLAWNDWWQAVQRRRDERPVQGETGNASSVEIFGVSATAAIYRRRALDDVAPVFDVGLESYYEDVDLAVRLRAAGWSARCVPAATARHAGSSTGAGLGAARWVRRNRYSVLGRTLGWRLLPRLPRIVLRDVLDLVHAIRALDAAGVRSIAGGCLAGLLRLPLVLSRGLLSPDELRRWRP